MENPPKRIKTVTIKPAPNLIEIEQIIELTTEEKIEKVEQFIKMVRGDLCDENSKLDPSQEEAIRYANIIIHGLNNCPIIKIVKIAFRGKLYTIF